MRVVMHWAFLLFVTSCSAPEYWIGTSDFQVASTSTIPGFTAKLWYPAIGGEEQVIGKSRIRPGYIAVPGAEIAINRKVPLIVLTHGSGGSADSMAWIAKEFVQQGALVVAADHPASSGGDPERLSMLEVWTQPNDVSLLLDNLLRSNWNQYINHENIAVVGFSLGGASAISLAGGRLRFERFPVFCESHDDGACQAFRHLFPSLDMGFYDRANANFYDQRLSAAVAIAPGFTESLTTESVTSLPIPLLIVVGGKDQQLPPSTHMEPIFQYLPIDSAIIEIEEAQHFSFLPVCGNGAIEILAETNEEFVCQEFGNTSREQIHETTTHAILDFLIAHGLEIDPDNS